LGDARERQMKVKHVNENNLRPGLIGVRLNFYTDKADVYFREGFTDTWIGNPKLRHIATVDFSKWNPFKNPEDVPPASELPDDDSDIDAAFGKQSWWAEGPDDADENDDSIDENYGLEQWWGFRWAYHHENGFVVSDDTFLSETHFDMSEKLDDEEGEAEYGYGVVDVTDGSVVIINYSWDMESQADTSSGAMEAIKGYLQTLDYPVDLGNIREVNHAF
jgi:hypothetical protein